MPERMKWGRKFTKERDGEAVFIATLQCRDCRIRTELPYKVTSPASMKNSSMDLYTAFSHIGISFSQLVYL